MTKDCLTPSTAGPRHFWTTQPDACGADARADNCGRVALCGSPGLVLQPVYDPCHMEGCFDADKCSPRAPKLLGATLATNDFVRSLALNILLTDAESRPSPGCGPRIGRRGGYWADAYRTDGLKTGSLLRQMPMKGTTGQLVALAREYAARDLAKLVTYGVASAVNVSANYAGSGVISILAEIIGRTGKTSVGISGQKLANEWAWT